jgi:hypothetical protein
MIKRIIKKYGFKNKENKNSIYKPFPTFNYYFLYFKEYIVLAK